jgi:hypothetical protein
MARCANRAARGREGAHAAQRRAGAAAAGTAVGSDLQGLSIRDRRGERLAGRPLPRALATPRLPLHVRARLHRRLPILLSDRGWLQRVRRPPGQPRRHSIGGVPGASHEAAGVQAANGVDIYLGVLARQRLQLRLQRLVHRRAAARGECRIQLPARGGVAAARGFRGWRRGARRRARGHYRNRCGHVYAREAWHERVRARRRSRLPRLFHLCARTGRPLGHVPVARPCTQGTQRDRHLVAPPRRVRQALSDFREKISRHIIASEVKNKAWTSKSSTYYRQQTPNRRL